MNTGATDRDEAFPPVVTPPAGPPTSAGPIAHEHEWDLRGVEFEGGSSIRRLECTRCDLVWFS